MQIVMTMEMPGKCSRDMFRSEVGLARGPDARGLFGGDRLIIPEVHAHMWKNVSTPLLSTCIIYLQG